MSRGIDHLVLAVHDLETARTVYERLGFTLTPTARHPFGTENSLVQLDGCFLELLAVADPDAFPVPAPGAFSFPRFNARYLERHEGMSMLVLDSQDAVADGKAFAASGIQAYLPFEFGRDAKQPDGTVARVGFKLAFVTDPYAPDAAYFTCQQLAPQFFWKPEFQRHRNTGRTVREVLMVSQSPDDHRAFFEAFTGVSEIRSTGAGLGIETARGTIRVETPQAAASEWGAAIDLKGFSTPRLAAIVVAVNDMDAAHACLEADSMPCERRGERLVVPAAEVAGVAVAFVPAGS